MHGAQVTIDDAIDGAKDRAEDREDDRAIEWIVAEAPVPYPEALAWMEVRAAAVAAGDAREAVWLVEHPPLYTSGTSADPTELLDPRFPVFVAGRGGRYTYHGPGQRVVYLVLDIGKCGRNVRCFIHAVEGWVIAALARLGVKAWRAPSRVGVWTENAGCEAKIGAIGIRVRRWVSMHGFSINVAPDLSHFDGIVPCGLSEFSVTSLQQLGIATNMTELDAALSAEFGPFLASLPTLPEN